ncbi:MAG: hypothetical protein FOGNACKC_00815 [Anaerolineae bacterium]|nr:hypothetical protein [Anaerolineae bacterium]
MTTATISIQTGQQLLVKDELGGEYTVQLAVADNGALNIYVKHSSAELYELDPGDDGVIGDELHFRIGSLEMEKNE